MWRSARLRPDLTGRRPTGVVGPHRLIGSGEPRPGASRTEAYAEPRPTRTDLRKPMGNRGEQLWPGVGKASTRTHGPVHCRATDCSRSPSLPRRRSAEASTPRTWRSAELFEPGDIHETRIAATAGATPRDFQRPDRVANDVAGRPMVRGRRRQTGQDPRTSSLVGAPQHLARALIRQANGPCRLDAADHRHNRPTCPAS